MATKRCAVVTGGNKGIGLEICRQLASNGIKVILTARDEKKGIKAVEELKACGLFDVLFHQLDVKDSSSIASFAKFIGTNFNKLDILIQGRSDVETRSTAPQSPPSTDQATTSPALRPGDSLSLRQPATQPLTQEAVNDENAHLLGGIIEQTYEMAEECLETNYYGTKRVTEALLLLLQLSNSPRIVNLSSYYGELSHISNEKVKAELQNVDNMTEEKIDEILQWFLRDFKEDKLKANGWPITVSAYKVSKAFVNAYTRLLAKKFPNMLVNCVHPGYIRTYITRNSGYMTTEEGAKAPVMLALLPNDGPSGVYFNQMNVSNF
ncbi:hypothetical protein LguiB_028827 [Lonicera macranthoides]